MTDAAPAPDAWAQLRAIADALDDQLLVLPDDLEADEPEGTEAPGSGIDPWDELRAIAGAAASDVPAPQQR